MDVVAISQRILDTKRCYTPYGNIDSLRCLVDCHSNGDAVRSNLHGESLVTP